MTTKAQRELVQFLEKHAFDPVLKAKPDDYPQAKRAKLEHVQRATEAEIERFRNYGSAEEVVLNFKRDLSSSKAKEVHRELEDLDLPTIGQCREDFLKLAEDLDID